MSFCGDVGYDLEREGESEEGTGESRQKTVVETLAASDTIAHQSEGHAWNDGEVDAGVVGEEGTSGFLNAIRGAGRERTFSFVNMEGQVHAHDGGQEDCLSLCMECTDEVVGVDFIGQRMIEEDGLDAIIIGDSFKQ